jgi:hypothetical protein
MSNLKPPHPKKKQKKEQQKSMEFITSLFEYLKFR